MKKSMKKLLAIVLTLVMVSGTFVSFAAVELNQEAVKKHYGQYENYLLLGDSVASGYRDVVTERDQQFNTENYESTYYRVPGSYADIITSSIIESNEMVSFAGPGYRTIEIRYMLEDDYAATCEDEYLFYCSNVNVHGYAGAEHFRLGYKEAVKNADLITLGVGGNDWGQYILWVITETLQQSGSFDELYDSVMKLIDGVELNLETVKKVVDVVSRNSDAIAAVLAAIPGAIEYGLTTFYKNWDIMIEDIYAYNPDVTLVVVGMSDNGVKGNYFYYDGVAGGPVTGSLIGGADSGAASAYIVEAIMAVANKPMIDGAKKYGYTYVDTKGTTYVESHPDAGGHAHIANKIIEALPDPVVEDQFSDMKPGNKYFASAEYCVANGIMSGLTDTTFGADVALTSGQLTAAINAITGANASTANNSDAKMIEFALAMLTGGAKKGFIGFFKGAGLMVEVLYNYGFKVKAPISRGEASIYFQELASL